MTTEPTVACAGGCSQHKPLAEAAAAGWELLPITGRYRCAQCSRELAEVGRDHPPSDER